jgi:hypothetical protein
MNRETKASTSLGVSIRERNTLGLKSTATGDSELVASNIVLSTTSRAGSVECNGFRPQ